MCFFFVKDLLSTAREESFSVFHKQKRDRFLQIVSRKRLAVNVDVATVYS
jgi:hypothetical protein